ncbi:transcriptional regulator GcvA [Brevundimonas sp. NIBR11]|uniref:transcriptional regulator GcvA n=1 Tax=Brevundimonas sp. NIBR11 TaxID=3015999 RepID=UPI0022F0D21A|nr:transcriptional regulator GcvA [Brevundimonas sp. NIBR11]WGM31937.1 Glycine cleavage system transcriptional activator [Brevundimonas sp. NIBR11]
MSEPDEPGRRLPPLNALKAFEAAARRLSISLAARELGVTPGAVSQQIKVLEDHSGAPLFRREGGAIALTELGARLHPVLRDAFEQLQRAADIVYGPAGRRSLAVSVPPSFAARWLAPRMVRFSAEHPEIEVWISADMQLADVAGGRVDVAVRYGLGGYPGVRSEILFEAGVIPVCSPALLTGRSPLQRPADLAHHTLIHVANGRVEEPRPDWAAWLKARGVTGVDASAGSRYDQTAFAIEDAANGRGVALAPRAFVAADLASGRLVAPFADGYLPTDMAYHVLTRRNGGREEARTFVAWLRGEADADDGVVDEL